MKTIIIMAVLMGALSGFLASFATTVYVLRYWEEREEHRRKARARRKRAEGHKNEDAFITHQEGQERPPESNMVLFPTERPASGTGRIRGAYRGPDGSVTFIGMEGAADV